MADLDPGYRRELAEQLRARAPFGSVDDGDIYVRLVGALLDLGWAKPPKAMPVVEPPARSLPRVEGD